MAKVSYSSLKLKTDTSVNTFEFGGQTIEVLKYLPAADVYDLIMITLQKANEDGYYNPFKLDVFFHLNLVYLYTNITFTDKQRENELKLYDCLKSNGLMDLVLENIDSRQYEEALQWIGEIVENEIRFKHSAAGVIRSLVTDLPANADAAAKIVDSFDPSQFQAVVDFATAANGGRPIMGTNKNRTIE